MAEKQFEKKVKAFLDEQGVWWLKTWSNGIQREGVPDLLVCCNGYFIGVELKNEAEAFFRAFPHRATRFTDSLWSI